MKVTEINLQKNNVKKYNIYIDGVYNFSADLDDVIKHAIKIDMELNQQQLEMLIDVCEYTKAFNQSLNMIEMKDYTIHEIEVKLKNKGYSDNTIEKVIIKLVDLGFLNDSKYLVKYCKDSIHIKKHGLKKIEYDLKKKGLTEHEIILGQDDKEAMYQHALELANKKYRQLEGKNDIKGKVYRYLVSKGYDYDMIKKITNKICNNSEDYFDCE
jgi:regulatory protein